MKSYHVIGIESKSGTFKNDQKEEVAYDNVVLKCLVTSTSAKDKIKIKKGFNVDEIKLKNDFENMVYAPAFKVYGMTDLVGCTLELDQNSDGKIEAVEVIYQRSLEELFMHLAESQSA